MMKKCTLEHHSDWVISFVFFIFDTSLTCDNTLTFHFDESHHTQNSILWKVEVRWSQSKKFNKFTLVDRVITLWLFDMKENDLLKQYLPYNVLSMDMKSTNFCLQFWCARLCLITGVENALTYKRGSSQFQLYGNFYHNPLDCTEPSP